ncbi:LAMI_0H09274g1_1 [Lachancea mirantina]|uniref:LAMI_0H09274g1_1 n=1 Tax=Lachancea mirantina TaxID=1230905 RepID=A0A1G4KGC9_9SACH|nr:LAMI_0H09274g1_1 [Lachancea mirantina]
MKVLALPVSFIEALDDTSRTSLMNVVNEAYGRALKKYQVILSNRIKGLETLFSDLGFHNNIDDCILFVSFDQKTGICSSFDHVFKEVEKTYGARWFKPVNIRPGPNVSISFGHATATAGFKPIKKENRDYMLTCFTSFRSGAGKELLAKSMRYVENYLGAQKLFATVIVEHELVDYYVKVHNFREIHTQLIKKEFVSEALEEGVNATRDFHLATLVKEL